MIQLVGQMAPVEKTDSKCIFNRLFASLWWYKYVSQFINLNGPKWINAKTHLQIRIKQFIIKCFFYNCLSFLKSFTQRTLQIMFYSMVKSILQL